MYGPRCPRRSPSAGHGRGRLPICTGCVADGDAFVLCEDWSRNPWDLNHRKLRECRLPVMKRRTEGDGRKGQMIGLRAQRPTWRANLACVGGSRRRRTCLPAERKPVPPSECRRPAGRSPARPEGHAVGRIRADTTSNTDTPTPLSAGGDRAGSGVAMAIESGATRTNVELTRRLPLLVVLGIEDDDGRRNPVLGVASRHSTRKGPCLPLEGGDRRRDGDR